MSTQKSVRDFKSDPFGNYVSSIGGSTEGMLHEELFLSGYQRAMDEMSAKIAELELKNQRLAAKLEDVSGSNLAAVQVVNEMSEEMDDLEAQNKKLGDVVLAMANALSSLAVKSGVSANYRPPYDLIKQLKQERGNDN